MRVVLKMFNSMKDGQLTTPFICVLPDTFSLMPFYINFFSFFFFH